MGEFQGKEHRYVTVRKTVLIPQKTGRLLIEPMAIEVVAGVPVGRRDLFGNMISQNTTFTVSTGTRFVNAKALPAENKPTNFSGAVGDFEFEVSTSKTKLKANESAQIKVEVSGRGNLKLIDLTSLDANKYVGSRSNICEQWAVAAA